MTVDPQAQGGPEIENLLAETRTFPPDPAFAAQANATAALYDEADADYVGFWDRQAEERLSWFTPVRRDARVGPPGREVVHRRRAQRRLQLRGPPRGARPGRQGRLPLDRRARRHAHAHVRGPDARELQGGQRAARAGRPQGRPGRDLHADDPGAPDRDARLRPDRRAAHGRLRRVLRGGAVGPHQRLRREGPDHRGRRLAAGQEGGPQAPRRRRRSSRRPRSSTSSSWTASATASHMVPRRDHWWHEIVDRQDEVCRPVPVDSEHMLYLLYTSGTTAKPKGILHTSAGYLLGAAFTHWAVFDIKPDDVYWCAADIGWVTGHSYIVYGPLANATTGRPVRGRAGRADVGPLVGDHRALQGQHPVLRADRDPRVHEAGRGDTRGPTTCRRCGSWARSASRSTPRPGAGTRTSSAAGRRPSWTRGGRPRPARS